MYFNRMQIKFLVLLILCTVSQQNSCQKSKSRNLIMSLTSRRNQTGHQVTEVGMARSVTDDSNYDDYGIDVEQGTKECSGTKSRYLVASIFAPPELAEGYELYPLVGRYKFHTKAQTWEQALLICQQEGAHLAIINSDLEAQVLKDIIHSRYAQITGGNMQFIAFLGFNDIVTEGKYLTIFGDSLDSGFAKWETNEPNNAGGSETHPGQDCGAINRDTGLLDDVNCKEPLSFFCEQEL